MTNYLNQPNAKRSVFAPVGKGILAASVSLLALTSQVANAAIDNVATVSGTYGTVAVKAEGKATVPVAKAAPDLSIVKTAGAPNLKNGADDRADAGDTITYTFVITNEGNVTLGNVLPKDNGVVFNGQKGTGSLGKYEIVAAESGKNAPSLAPGEKVTYTVVYTLSALDVYHSAGVGKGVTNTANSVATLPDGKTPYEDKDVANAVSEIPHKDELKMTKEAKLQDTNKNGVADFGEKIEYVYTVTNTGNVAITGIAITDIHEGTALPAGSVTNEKLVKDGPLAGSSAALASTDAAIDAKWDVLQPEAVVQFTYTHTVTQEEVDNG